MTLRFAEAFDALVQDRFDAELARQSFDAIFAGAWNPAQIAGFLTSLRMRDDRAEVIAAAAQAMRAVMLPVTHDHQRLLDTCGTGGDGSGSLNLSTGAALMCAAAGVPVAKHGNRAASSQSGSADVLEALGIPLQLSADAAARVLSDVGITFMLAPTHHPAMRFAGPVRKELGVRTIFNCLGPLANPARATHQLLGAYSDHLRPQLARTLQQLGSVRAWVVWGQDGLDEISPFGPTNVTQLSDGALSELCITPRDFGLEISPAGATRGGDAEHNAKVMRLVLAGEPHPSRDAFLLNAAAALVVATGSTPPEALALAVKTIESGAALHKLEAWREAALKRAPQTQS
jgi:anthranilate phosphoribosyltransferase